jgi:hypothetical protein
MDDFREREAVSCLVGNLLDRDDVWWSPLLVPGQWEAVTGEAAAAFLTRWIDQDRRSNRPPFAALYPPLKILRLDLDFVPITLWQVAVDVCFDVGVVDLVEQADPADTSSELSYLAESWGGLPQLINGVLTSETSLGPIDVRKVLSRTPTLRSDAEAALCASLLLSLSRRDAGRLSIVDRACSLALLPGGPHGVTLEFSDLPVAAPSALKTDVGWDFACDAWLGDGIWRLQGSIDKTASITMRSASRIANVPPKPPEAYVGWVRLFDRRLPPSVRLPKA